jgi:hypothetical protein
MLAKVVDRNPVAAIHPLCLLAMLVSGPLLMVLESSSLSVDPLRMSESPWARMVDPRDSLTLNSRLLKALKRLSSSMDRNSMVER